ncbi:hypothetical protein C7M84_017962 [Penaeus vannamei]|uniref:Uncharacterized protein n=1 Tax=Penaeus vannamei TaxID=6689 RepID=A0A3R7P8V8_PENVA|nr:hypothetical protein C7M84_017962 [Penaeus vannamei]
MSAVQAIYRAAAAVAGERGQLGHRSAEDAPRQLEQVVNVVSSFLPDVPLDAPTVMSLIIIFAFILQFYWTSYLSTSPVVCHRRPAVTARTQTVTPAPAPEWRYMMRDFDLPKWVLMQKVDVKHSGVQYRKARSAPLERPWAQPRLGRSRVESRSRVTDGEYWPRKQEWLEEQRWGRGPPLAADEHRGGAADGYGGGPGRFARARTRTCRRTTPLLTAADTAPYPANTAPYPADTVPPWAPSGNEPVGHPSGEESGGRPQMPIDYDVDASLPKPLDLSSHRLVHYPVEESDMKVEGAAADLLHAAERWGNRLKNWHVLGKEGAEMRGLLRQTGPLLPAAARPQPRCCDDEPTTIARSSPPTTTIVTTTRPTTTTATGTTKVKKVPKDRGPGRLYQPEEVKEEQEKPEEDVDAKDQLQRRHDQHRVDQDDDTQQQDTRVTESGSLMKKSWNIYFFMSVMAVLVFLMDASYRILRVVSFGASRAFHDPHYDLLATLSAAIRRWDDQPHDVY